MTSHKNGKVWCPDVRDKTWKTLVEDYKGLSKPELAKGNLSILLS